ncbi:hypothetical protein O3P69_013073 [Scylla paramamosain]|uniref:Uncharacterized protein n=1 Tax=Scylla paramamosain TaxID=85552 RepID=A0AAW0SHT9_SCYPA
MRTTKPVTQCYYHPPRSDPSGPFITSRAIHLSVGRITQIDLEQRYKRIATRVEAAEDAAGLPARSRNLLLELQNYDHGYIDVLSEVFAVDLKAREAFVGGWGYLAGPSADNLTLADP